jgi:hypothetical protein
MPVPTSTQNSIKTPTSVIVKPPTSPIDLAPYVDLSFVKTEYGQYFAVINNRSDEIIYLTYDRKIYDKDNSFVGGQTMDTRAGVGGSSSYGDSYVFPKTTNVIPALGYPDGCSEKISNIRVFRIDNPVYDTLSKTKFYPQALVVDSSAIIASLIADPKWGYVGPKAAGYYCLVGEIRNVSDRIPAQYSLKVVFKNKGIIVGVVGGAGGVVPPPGEKSKFAIGLGYLSVVNKSPIYRDTYDTYEISICPSSHWIVGFDKVDPNW